MIPFQFKCLFYRFDKDSALERFTWFTIADDKYIPCLFRCKEKFCSLKMAEISVMGDLLKNLPLELYECVRLTTYNVRYFTDKFDKKVNDCLVGNN